MTALSFCMRNRSFLGTRFILFIQQPGINFTPQFQIGEKEREAVKWGWEQEAGNTMFHVVNAYTRAAQFEGLSAEASYRLQKVGGMVLGMVK